jgi:hypothetical protein
MLAKPTEPNPVYKRLTQRARPPTLAQTAVLSAILFGICAVLVIQQIPTPLPLIETFAILLIPSIVAGAAALITVTDTQTEAFTLQELTLLTPTAIVGGYTSAAFFRTRLLFVLVIALLPMLFYNTPTSLSASNSGCHVFVSRSKLEGMLAASNPPCAVPGDIRFVLEDLLQAAGLIVILLAAPAAALFGVWRGLASKWPVIAVGGSIIIPIILAIAYLVPLTLLSPFWGIEYSCLSLSCPVFHIWTDYAWLAGVSLIIVALFTFDFFSRARRAV